MSLPRSTTKPLFILMEAAYPTGDLTDWALGLENAAARLRIPTSRSAPHGAVWYGWTAAFRSSTSRASFPACTPRRAWRRASARPGPRPASASRPDTLEELLPAGLDDSIIKMLDEAGFLTFRSYAGLEDFFAYHAKVLSPEKSDFQYAEDIRVKNKVIREVRKEALLLLNDDIDMTDFDGETQARAKFLAAPLDRMVAAKEISRAEVTIPEGQAESFLETGSSASVSSICPGDTSGRSRSRSGVPMSAIKRKGGYAA